MQLSGTQWRKHSFLALNLLSNFSPSDFTAGVQLVSEAYLQRKENSSGEVTRTVE